MHKPPPQQPAGPHIPLPLVADTATVHTLSELGVILLMFSLGLEFSIGKLAAVSQKAGPASKDSRGSGVQQIFFVVESCRFLAEVVVQAQDLGEVAVWDDTHVGRGANATPAQAAEDLPQDARVPGQVTDSFQRAARVQRH